MYMAVLLFFGATSRENPLEGLCVHISQPKYTLWAPKRVLLSTPKQIIKLINKGN